MLTIEYIGKYGTIFLPFYALYVFRDTSAKLQFFYLGYLSSVVISILLKLLIKSPSPLVDPVHFNILIKQKKFFFGNIDSYEMLGMPSGNSLLASFAFVYFISALRSVDIISMLTLIIVVASDLFFRRHFVDQVVVGFIIGSLIGYISYMICCRYIEGAKSVKKEDYAMNVEFISNQQI